MQLSPIQCTYSNIFIRFFKFFPANTIIYQNSHRVPDNCAFEITLLQAIMLTLLLVCAFFSASYASFLTRQSSQATTVCLTLAYSFSQRVHSIPLGPLYSILRGFCNMVPFRTSYASFLTSQSSQATIACLMLAYSFSPKVQSIFWGPHNGQCLVMT